MADDKEISAKMNTEMDTETNTGMDIEMNTGMDTEMNTGMDTEMNTGMDTEMDTGMDAGIDMEIKECLKQIDQAEFVLVGLGEEFGLKPDNRERLERAYCCLEELLRGKTYFILTLAEDDLIYHSGLLSFFIAAPFLGERGENALPDQEQQWNGYLNWLTATLGHRLCILELGAGFASPQVIRWPFEKNAEYNQKAVLIRVNDRFPQLPPELAERGISLKMKGTDFLQI